MNKFKTKTLNICCRCHKQIKYRKSLKQVGTDIYIHKGCWNQYINLSTTNVYDLV